MVYDIRTLRETDKDAILEIAKHTWEGHDYLPFSFESWLNDRNSHTAAIEQDGRVIALANLRVIEDGRTGWMEGLRVHPDYRGMGLAKRLTNHVVQTAISLKLERIRYTTATDNLESLHLGESVGMSRKFNLAVFWFENPTQVSWRSSNEEIVSIDAKRLALLLAETKLLPCGVIILDWKALDATPESLEKIGQSAPFCATLQHGNMTALSMGFSRESSEGKQWQFTVYAKSENVFLDHLSHQLVLATEEKCKSIFCAYQEEFSPVMRSLEWTKIENEEDWTLTLLERVL
ncbi:MAG: GNAT family N-acetyltransferase [Candidatus Thorarchaeota archaeon]